MLSISQTDLARLEQTGERRARLWLGDHAPTSIAVDGSFSAAIEHAQDARLTANFGGPIAVRPIVEQRPGRAGETIRYEYLEPRAELRVPLAPEVAASTHAGAIVWVTLQVTSRTNARRIEERIRQWFEHLISGVRQA